jgi:hypothetical protein
LPRKIFDTGDLADLEGRVTPPHLNFGWRWSAPDFSKEKELRRAAVGALVVALFSAPAFAAISDVDTDGDGMATFEELSAVYTDLTEEGFAELDTSDDGFVDEAELTAAFDAGKLVAPAQ